MNTLESEERLYMWQGHVLRVEHREPNPAA